MLDLDFALMAKLKLERVQSLMKKKDLDALLVNSYDSVRYLTDFPMLLTMVYSHRNAALAIRGVDYPILLPASPDVMVAKKSGFKEVRGLHLAYSDWPPIIKEVLDDHKVTDGRIGIEERMVTGLYLGLTKELPSAEIVDATDVVTEAKMVKNDEELKLIDESTSIAEMAMQTAIIATKTGIGKKEIEVGAEAANTILMAGADLSHTLVMSGENAAILYRNSTEKRIRSQEMVIFDLGAIYYGYCSDFARTAFSTGRPTEEQKEIYSVVANAMREITKAIKPGVMVSKVDSVGRDVINEAGYGDFTYPHLTAHGIGTRVHEKPYITEPGVDHKLEPGMVFSAEPGIFKPGIAGCRIEETIVVTESGSKTLTKIDYDEILMQ